MRLLLATAIFLSVITFGACSALSPVPQTNKLARDEAQKMVNEAENAYTSGTEQMDEIFAKEMGKNKLAAVKSNKSKFEQAAANFKIAKEKFAQASIKFKEALNGGNDFDSALHARYAMLRKAYDKWSQLSEVQMQLAGEAINIQDIKSFLDKTAPLEEKAKTLNKEVNAGIEAASK